MYYILCGNTIQTAEGVRNGVFTVLEERPINGSRRTERYIERAQKAVASVFERGVPRAQQSLEVLQIQKAGLEDADLAFVYSEKSAATYAAALCHADGLGGEIISLEEALPQFENCEGVLTAGASTRMLGRMLHADVSRAYVPVTDKPFSASPKKRAGRSFEWI